MKRTPMTNNAAPNDPRQRATSAAEQTVVIVNGSPEMVDVLDMAVDAGHYHVVFVDSFEYAYSHVKRMQPNLVIVCVGLDDAAGLQVLSMLSLDEATRRIPVFTYMVDDEEAFEEDAADAADAELFVAPTAARSMN